jgi:hypothetical protein
MAVRRPTKCWDYFRYEKTERPFLGSVKEGAELKVKLSLCLTKHYVMITYVGVNV